MNYRPQTPVITTLCISLMALHVLSACGCADSGEAPKQENHVTRARHDEMPTVEKIDSILDAGELFAPWKYIILHHSATQSGSVESIHATHRQRRDANGNPWRGIGYHFVIGNGQGMADGEVQATFRWQQQTSGAHAGARIYNDYGIGICLIGNFEQNGPTSAQIKAASDLVSQLKAQFGMTQKEILKHGDLKATACPGRLFPFQEIAASPSARSQDLASQRRSRFSSGKPGHMEGIKNVVSIQRSRAANRNRATQIADDAGTE